MNSCKPEGLSIGCKAKVEIESVIKVETRFSPRASSQQTRQRATAPAGTNRQTQHTGLVRQSADIMGSSSSSSSSTNHKNDSDYGDIMEVETTGASRKTAQQDNLGYAGIRASHKMAEMDEERMKVYKKKIHNVASLLEIDPVILAAIISRESRAGNTLKDGWGDYGKAWGLMQVDIHPDGGRHEPKGKWDSEEHLIQATEILLLFIDKISKKFPRWTREQQLKGGLAAYNMGDGNVHSYGKVDENTTGGDYSNDVVARAQWYKRKCFFNNCS